MERERRNVFSFLFFLFPVLFLFLFILFMVLRIFL